MAPVGPVTFEIVRHRLFSIVEEAVAALKSVSGTTITAESHDLMVSLYRPDGGLLACGLGFLHHIVPASRAVKFLLEEYSDDPGIFEDDMYLMNDPYTAALHAPDVYLIAPIHHRGELVGFVADFVHVTDIGAVDPMGFSPNATSRYHEGFQTRGIKLIERGHYRKDVSDTILNMVRDPEMVALDIRSLVAACNVAKMRMQDLVGEYTFDTLDTISQQLIERSEKQLRQRLRELPDGTWRTRQYLDCKDIIARVNLAMTKKDDRLIFDFTGSDSQVPFGHNSTYWGTMGGSFAPLFPLLCYDMVWNDGLIKPVEFIMPERTLINCESPAPVSIATIGVIQLVNNAALHCISKMLSSSPKYRDEATAVWDGDHVGVTFFHGTTQYGGFTAWVGAQGFGGTGGARAFKDAVELGGEIPNLVTRPPNVESVEHLAPLLTLYTNVLCDTGGPGKYRGGLTNGVGVTRHDSDQVNFGAYAKGIHVPMSYGLNGGYPGSCADVFLFKKTNLWERPDELPLDLKTTPGQPEPVTWGTYEIEDGDVRYSTKQGGGGYGDPLDREMQAVWQDVRNGFVSNEAAEKIYGVIFGPDGPDEQESHTLRTNLKALRLQDGDASEERLTLCPSCDDEMLKRPVVMKEKPLGMLGEARFGDPPFVIREFACVGCGTLVDTEVAAQGDPTLYDELAEAERVPEATAVSA